ncbi:hypothetical protein [Alistipes sp.]|uniref:hypothetical protein n=1 Tax=Alistipes sp. TaxID=1872444 RepID=UPI0031FD2D33
METKRELKILAWIILVFAAVFFLPLGSERFMTAIDATLGRPGRAGCSSARSGAATARSSRSSAPARYLFMWGCFVGL